MAPSARRAYSVTVTGPNVKLTVSQATGISRSGSVREVWNGGATAPSLISGRPQWGPVTLQIPYDPNLHQGLARILLKSRVGTSAEYTISRQDKDGNGVRVGSPLTLTGCRLLDVSIPDYDEESDDPGYLTMQFRPSNMA